MTVNTSTLFKKIFLSFFTLSFLSSVVYSEPNISLSELAELGTTLSRPILLANKLSKYKDLTLDDLDSVQQVNRASFYYSLSRLISEALSFYNRPGQNARYLLPVLCIDAVESFTHFCSGQRGDKTLLNIVDKKHALAISIDVLESLLASYQILSKTQDLKKSEEVFKRGLYGLSLLVRYSNELYLYSANGHKVKLYVTALSLLSIGLCNDLMQFKREVEREREERQRQRQHEEWLRDFNERQRQREEQNRQQAREDEQRQREFDEWVQGFEERQRQREERERQEAEERAQRREERERREREEREQRRAEQEIAQREESVESTRLGRDLGNVDDNLFYEILGLETDASQRDIIRKYRDLAQTYHPDKWSSDLSEEQRIEFRKRWDEISNSYGHLTT